MTDNHSRRESWINAIGEGKFSSCVDELLERALQGDSVASLGLGHIYFRGGDGVRRDYKKAAYWFEKVSLKDDTKGHVASRLGGMYYRGLGVAKDYDKAAKYLRSAALRGDSNSMVLFAMLQKKGKGTLKKPSAAKAMLRSSICDSRLSLMVRLFAFVRLYW